MKKVICCLMMLCMLVCSGALANEISMLDGQYTDVPSVMTQDAVVAFDADQACSVTILQPYAKAVELLDRVYEFVWKEGNRPARYYDEETQRKIQELAQVDIDILHMTEFMALELAGEPEDVVHMEALFDVEYYPGQLIIVVMGIEQENGEYRWYPYRGDVRMLGMIEYDIPVQEFNEMKEQKVIFHVLTDRVGARGDQLADVEVIHDRVFTPSRGAMDLISIRRWHSTSGETIDDQFSIFLVEKTEEMKEEIERIGQHIDEEKPAIQWFPIEIANQAQLLQAEGVDVNDMLIYDIVAVMAKDYKDTYGDVATENLFASVYDQDKGMVALLGFPIEDAQEAPFFDWYCLRAEALENSRVEIVFKQLVIPTMEEEPAMLVVFSEPINENAE